MDNLKTLSDDFFGVNKEKLRPEVLLMPNIPKPLHGVNPRTIMGKQWWDIKRNEAYASTNYHCISCGIHKFDDFNYGLPRLDAHELYSFDYDNFSCCFLDIVPLCTICHDGIHTGRISSLFDKGLVSEEYCWFVYERKKQVCGSYGEVDKIDYTDNWGKWRLEFNGKLYEPIYKTYDEWKAHYERGE
jgi:hypothetical protein